MNRSKFVFAWVAAFITFLLIQACATIPIPAATKKESAALGITIEGPGVKTVLSGDERTDYTQVFFIKLANKEDSVTKEIIFKSNYHHAFSYDLLRAGIDTFLLDIEPGFYAAVGAIGKGRKSEINVLVFFPEQMVKESISEVKPNTMAYMGRFILSGLSRVELMGTADKIQSFYFNNQLLDKEQKYHGKNMVPNWAGPQFHFQGMESFEKSSDSETKFLERNKATFKSTDWANNISHRLEMLRK